MIEVYVYLQTKESHRDIAKNIGMAKKEPETEGAKCKMRTRTGTRAKQYDDEIHAM